jgi:hypothetical protein
MKLKNQTESVVIQLHKDIVLHLQTRGAMCLSFIIVNLTFFKLETKNETKQSFEGVWYFTAVIFQTSSSENEHCDTERYSGASKYRITAQKITHNIKL